MQVGYAQTQPGNPQRWEYQWEKRQIRSYTNLTDATDVTLLEQRGNDGWELVSVVACGTSKGSGVQANIAVGFTVYYYFKRPKA